MQLKTMVLGLSISVMGGLPSAHANETTQRNENHMCGDSHGLPA